MFGRFGWAEILVIVVLVLILFGHNKIPGMMKNLADGINVFKKEIKNTDSKKKAEDSAKKNPDKKISGEKKTSARTAHKKTVTAVKKATKK